MSNANEQVVQDEGQARHDQALAMITRHVSLPAFADRLAKHGVALGDARRLEKLYYFGAQLAALEDDSAAKQAAESDDVLDRLIAENEERLGYVAQGGADYAFKAAGDQLAADQVFGEAGKAYLAHRRSLGL